jgi:hypothetical protein
LARFRDGRENPRCRAGDLDRRREAGTASGTGSIESVTRGFEFYTPKFRVEIGGAILLSRNGKMEKSRAIATGTLGWSVLAAMPGFGMAWRHFRPGRPRVDDERV